MVDTNMKPGLTDSGSLEQRLDEILNTDASLVEGYARMNERGTNESQKQHQRTLAPA